MSELEPLPAPRRCEPGPGHIETPAADGLVLRDGKLLLSDEASEALANRELARRVAVARLEKGEGA